LDEIATGTTIPSTITFQDMAAGKHRLSLFPLETPQASKTLFFSVNLDGPTVEINTADREYAIDGSAAPMGRNALVYRTYNTYVLSAQRFAILEYDDDWGKYLVLDGEERIFNFKPILYNILCIIHPFSLSCFLIRLLFHRKRAFYFWNRLSLVPFFLTFFDLLF